jgi:hypothetical protein
MPRRGALLNDAAVPVPVRPVPGMSVLPYAAVRRVARHTWFHDPVFPFVHLADLWPLRLRRSTLATNARRLRVTASPRRAAGHAPTIRLAAGPNLGRLSRAHDIGGFGFPPPRRRNCARRACPAACAAARDSQLDGAASHLGLVTPSRTSHPPEGHGRSSSLADLVVAATSARRGRVHIRLAPPVKPGAGRRSPVPIW